MKELGLPYAAFTRDKFAWPVPLLPRGKFAVRCSNWAAAGPPSRGSRSNHAAGLQIGQKLDIPDAH